MHSYALQPLSQPPQAAKVALWEEQRIAKQHLAKLPIPTSEQLAPGHKSEWKLWKSLNRLCMCMGRSKTNLSKWGFADAADTACGRGSSEQTMQDTCWDAHFLKMNAAFGDLMRRLPLSQAAWPNIWPICRDVHTKEESVCKSLSTREDYT